MELARLSGLNYAVQNHCCPKQENCSCFEEFGLECDCSCMLVSHCKTEQNELYSDYQIQVQQVNSPLNENEGSLNAADQAPMIKFSTQEFTKSSPNNDEDSLDEASGGIVQGPITTHVTNRDSDNNEKLVQYNLKPQTVELFETLKRFKINFQTELYKPKDQRLNVDPNIFYCKNLFLKDRKGQFYLVICHEDLNLDLKQLRKTLEAYRNFNFGTSTDLGAILHTEPGGVTPLGLMFPSARDVQMVIHKGLLKERAQWMFHPLDSELAIKMSQENLMRFLRHFNHSVKIVK